MIIRDPDIIFIHIPKCAGKSMEKSFQAEFPKTKILKKSGHQTAKDYIKLLGEGKYKNFYSITIVRNPWDRMASLFEFLNRFPKKRPFSLKDNTLFDNFIYLLPDLYLEKPKYFSSICDFIMVENEIVVDTIININELGDGIKKLNNKLGLNLKLNNENVNPKSNRNYKHYYNNNTKKIIENFYSKEIELFNFKF